VKTLSEIKRKYSNGDYIRVAEIVKVSESTVKKVVSGTRPDNHNIQKVFSDLLDAREKLAEREAKRRARKNQRLVYE
jgi:hypothetical protein